MNRKEQVRWWIENETADRVIAQIIADRERIVELERIIADNCDPSDATEDDAKIIQECFYATYPENL